MKPMVEIRNLKKYYGKGENLVKAVDHTNLTIERGKFTAIVGRSGSGKSTMLHLMGGLDRPDKGRVFIDGEDIFKLKDEQLAVFRRKKIGFIFQDYNLLPSLNVWENIVLPLGLDNKKVDHINVACAYGINSRDTVKQRCFSGAGRPHNTEKFSGLNGKADILNGLRDIPFIAIVFLDMFQFQNGTHVSDLLKSFLYWIINGLGIFLYQVFLHSSYRNVRIAEPVSSVPR